MKKSKQKEKEAVITAFQQENKGHNTKKQALGPNTKR